MVYFHIIVILHHLSLSFPCLRFLLMEVIGSYCQFPVLGTIYLNLLESNKFCNKAYLHEGSEC